MKTGVLIHRPTEVMLDILSKMVGKPVKLGDTIEMNANVYRSNEERLMSFAKKKEHYDDENIIKELFNIINRIFQKLLTEPKEEKELLERCKINTSKLKKKKGKYKNAMFKANKYTEKN